MPLTRPRYSSIYDTDYKQSCRVATTADVTLSGGAPLIVDGVTLVAGDRVLVKSQANLKQNGIYTVTSAGTGSDGTWTRSLDANDTVYKISPGMQTMIEQGNVSATKLFRLTSAPPLTLGTTDLIFNDVSTGGSNPTGANATIQFNNGGALGSVTGFTWSGTTLTATSGLQATPIGNSSASTGAFTTLSASGITSITNATVSTATSNGALVVSGGAGVAGNVYVGGLVNATGNVNAGGVFTSGNVNAGGVFTAGNVSGNYILGNGALLTGVITSVANINLGTSNVTVTSSGGPILVGVGGSRIVQFTTAGIENLMGAGVGNIGNASSGFNTVFAKATSAQYADLAEIYTADNNYEPGTVVVFGGEKEITVTTESHDTRVAGVISTNPAYLMNSESVGLPVAFTGRVPCRVQGPVSKGDVLVTASTPGVAQRIGVNWQPGCILGKSLEEINSNEIKTIEVVVGRF